MLRCFRLVKIYKFWMFLDRTERHTNYPNVFRTLSLMHYILAIYHWNACLFNIITKKSDFGNPDWPRGNTTDFVFNYLQSYYWCTIALTTVGGLPKPRTKGEYAFVVAQLLFGVMLFASVLGYVANIVTNVSAGRKEFQGLFIAYNSGCHSMSIYGQIPLEFNMRIVRAHLHTIQINPTSKNEAVRIFAANKGI